MNREISDELLARFQNGNCTDTEKNLVENWYNSYEAMPDLYHDSTQEEVKKIMSDSKASIDESITSIEQNSKINLEDISKVQSWFLKTSN